MNKLSKSVLNKIKSKHLKPRAHWQFVLKNIVLWGLVVVAVVAAGVFVASLIQELLEAEWDIAHRYPGGPLNFFRQAISVTWLIAIVATIALAFVFFRKTKRGYRYGVSALAGIILVASIVLGTSLAPTKIPEKFREFEMQNFGRRFDEQRWQAPEEGLLIGDIVEVGDELLVLSARDQKIWKVDISEAMVPPFLQMLEGENVRVIGEQTGEDSFRADFVKPGTPPNFSERGLRDDRPPPGSNSRT